jgi:hypothetical protein
MVQHLTHNRRFPSRFACDLVEPANPVLFLAAGPLAVQALQELPHVANVLHVRLSGQFGYVTLLPTSDGGLNRSVAVDSQIPPLESRREQRPPYLDADPWDERLRSLVRKFRPHQAITPFGEPMQSTIKVYAIYDLRHTECVRAGLRAIETIRREPLQLDLTGLLLTGRTARFHANEDEYRNGLKLVLEANQADCLLHRLYVLDGKNAKQYWLQSEIAMAWVAAECIWHHGLAPYSAALRKHERTRLSARQPIEEVFGSLHARIMKSDRTVVQTAVALEVKKCLFSKQDMSSSCSEGQELQAIARQVGDELSRIYESSSKTKVAGSSAALADQKLFAKRAHAALTKGLRSACGDHPSQQVRPRLRRFLEAFRNELSRLQTLVLLIDCRRMRQEAYEGLRQAASRLGALPLLAYRWFVAGPTTWDRAGPKGAGEFGRLESRVRSLPPLPADVTPPDKTRVEPPKVLLPTPPSRLRQIGGLLLLVLGTGTAWATLGPNANHLWLLLAAALAFGGTIWLDWPSKTAWHQRTERRPNEEDQGLCLHYRLKVGGRRIAAGSVTLVVGIGLGIWSFRLAPGKSIGSIGDWLVLTAAAGAAMLAFVPRSDDHVRGVPGDASDLASVLYPWWRWIAYGVLLAVWAWIVSTWSLRLRPDKEWWLSAGLAGTLLSLALGLLTFPLTGRRGFYFHPPREPDPDWRSKPAPAPVASEVEKYLISLRRWCTSLLPDRSAPITEDVLHWPYPQRVGSILDAVVPNWPAVLADACLTEMRSDVNDPQQWAECLLEELDHVEADSLPMEQVFALHLVKKWIKGRPMPEVISLLRPDPHWLERYFEHAVAPLWSVPTQDYDIKAGVVVLDRHLSELAALEDETAATYRLQRVEWPETGMVVLARLVQGVGPGIIEQDASGE